MGTYVRGPSLGFPDQCAQLLERLAVGRLLLGHSGEQLDLDPLKDVGDERGEYARRQRGLELRMIAVCGPRIDPDSLPVRDGLEVVEYVHGLSRHLAACDMAVVQGGLTTCTELAAAKRPFLYFPLRRHLEQNLHVRHRLERYGAGRRAQRSSWRPSS